MVSTTTVVVVVVVLLATARPSASTESEEAVTMDLDQLQLLERLLLDGSVVGPESIAFDADGNGPYTGVSNGRVIMWRERRWVDFAANPNGCRDDDNDDESECGRPLGLQFHRSSGRLYIADAYFGLMAAGAGGGEAEVVASEAEGVPFRFTNGIDVDQGTGVVYFTDSSTHFTRKEHVLLVLSGDASGRLMSYDPATNNLTVLLRDLSFPNGVAVGTSADFVLVAETTNCRVIRYNIRGPLAGTYDVFAELPGYPDNIKRNAAGEYWVALSTPSIAAGDLLPAAERTVAVRLGGGGEVVEVLNAAVLSATVSEVEEREGRLWLGSVVMPYVGVYGTS